MDEEVSWFRECLLAERVKGDMVARQVMLRKGIAGKKGRF